MESWHGANLALARFEREPPSPRFGDAFFDAEQGLCGGPPEADQDVWIGKFDLAQDEGQADLRLLRRRCSVSRRPPWHDVGDINGCAVETDRGQHAIEQFAGPADERQALNVFVAAGSFPDVCFIT